MKQISQGRMCVQSDTALCIHQLVIDEGGDIDFYFNVYFSINRLLRVFVQRTIAVVNAPLRLESNPSKKEKLKHIECLLHSELDHVAILDASFAVCIQFAHAEVIGFRLFNIHHSAAGFPVGEVIPVTIIRGGFSRVGPQHKKAVQETALRFPGQFHFIFFHIVDFVQGDGAGGDERFGCVGDGGPGFAGVGDGGGGGKGYGRDQRRFSNGGDNGCERLNHGGFYLL